jgi:hypothetical protein
MKYIKQNLEPILMGFVIALITIYLFNTISDVIIKIALIKNK